MEKIFQRELIKEIREEIMEKSKSRIKGKESDLILGYTMCLVDIYEILDNHEENLK